MDETMEMKIGEPLSTEDIEPENGNGTAGNEAESSKVEEPLAASGIKRAAPRDINDEQQIRKKICGPPEDRSEELEELMATVGDNTEKNIVEILESLRSTLVENLETEEDFIINVFARCIKFKPEKLTIYSTLSGLVNVSSAIFGNALLEKIIFELNLSLAQGEFDIALRILTFVADLGNTGVISLNTVSNFLNSFTAFVSDENLQTDFFVYAVLHTLPWIGRSFYLDAPELLQIILDKLAIYINGRKKHHLKSLQVWTGKLEQEQDDYIDSLWNQILQLQEDNWNEEHILRVDIAFKKILADGVKHELPEVVIPKYDETIQYPLPRIVFRLFTEADCSDISTPLPKANSIERFLVEEDLNWIISNNYLNRQVCARELLAYIRADSVPLEHCIVEVIFSQLFRLPDAPYLELFYSALFIELCRKSPHRFTDVLTQATHILYKRTSHMQLTCLERFVRWFSYHLSNFHFRWMWDEWSDCITLDEFNPKRIFVREVLERCMRLSYHKKVAEMVPEDFISLIPREPVFFFVVDDVTHPAHEESRDFAKQIRSKAAPDAFLLAVKRNAEEIQEGECIYDPDHVAIFTGTLLKVTSATISHTFAAINRYHNFFTEIVKYPDIMQPVLLRTIHECWGSHTQLIILVLDKLLKVNVFDPHIIIAWIFSGDLKDEAHRSWVWEVLNLAITRASKEYYLYKETREELERTYNKKLAKIEALKKNSTGDDLLPEGEEMDVVDEEDYVDGTKPVDDRLTYLADELGKAVINHDKASGELRNVVLDICHKFSLAITENLYAADEEHVSYDTSFYRFLVGRFKEVLILHWRDVFLYWKDVERELVNSSAIDDRIREIFVEFRALKF